MKQGFWKPWRQGANLARMGKARRDAKLARRATMQAIKEERTFSWKKILRRMALIAPRVLLVVFGMVLVQTAAVALGWGFAATPIGQLLIFGVFYLALFRWIYAPMMQADRNAMSAARSLKK
jgi:hypothetical protein